MIESEKLIEKKVVSETKKMGGIAIKLSAIHFVGLPDRLCLFKKGRICFIETKTTGKKASAIQMRVHTRLRELGFRVEIIDNSEQLKRVLSEYEG